MVILKCEKTMKKYLYLLFAAFVATTMVACTEKVGTEPGNDPNPVVTIYTLAAPADYDPDQTVALRLAPNNKVDKMYILAELKATKDAYIKEKGEDAYANYVVQNGSEVSLESLDVVIPELMGLHAITVVALDKAGNKFSYETTYKGILWIDAGQAYIFQNMCHNGVAYFNGYVNVQRQDDCNIFRVVDMYHQLGGNTVPSNTDSVLTFEFDANHDLVSFGTSYEPYIYVNFGGDHGYWVPGQYPSYCYVKSGEDEDGKFGYVSHLVVSGGSLYTGGYIYIYPDAVEWFE